MSRFVPRFREAQIDSIFARNLAKPNFGATFLALAELNGEAI